MKTSIFVLLITLLSGCGSSASRITTPAGGSGYFVRCSETKEGCFRKAISICPAGYQVLDSENISPTKDRSAYFEMLIQCDSSWKNVNRILQNEN
ncbi:MAG: hypothetical protein HQM13_16980 [SAR324 cluster bacterium]|nr:hypothetical protein [SAR324 cluster bacterium]